MTEKFCVNCKHCYFMRSKYGSSKQGSHSGEYLCEHPSLILKSLVTGEYETSPRLCRIMRKDQQVEVKITDNEKSVVVYCGPDAELFEGKDG